MTNSGQLRDAKARFSEFLHAAIKKGLQIVTPRGRGCSAWFRSTNGGGCNRISAELTVGALQAGVIDRGSFGEQFGVFGCDSMVLSWGAKGLG